MKREKALVRRRILDFSFKDGEEEKGAQLFLCRYRRRRRVKQAANHVISYRIMAQESP